MEQTMVGKKVFYIRRSDYELKDSIAQHTSWRVSEGLVVNIGNDMVFILDKGTAHPYNELLAVEMDFVGYTKDEAKSFIPADWTGRVYDNCQDHKRDELA
jgi:hypothetical protein